MATTITRYVNTASSGGDGTTNNTSGSTAAFATLAAAEAALRRDLVTNDEVLIIECSGTTADTTQVTWNTGWTTDATRYIEVRGNNTTGKWDDNKYRMVLSNTQVMTNSGVNHLRFYQFQFSYSRTTGASQHSPIRINARTAAGGVDLRFERCIFRCTGIDAAVTANTYCIDVRLDASGHKFAMLNCVGYDFSQSTGIGGILTMQPSVATSAAYYVYNCTLSGNNRGVNAAANAANGCTAKNTISIATAAPFNGTYNSASTNNLSSTASVPGSSGITNASVTFVDSGNGDFHIASGDTSGAKTGGANLTSDSAYPFSTDIDGQTRPSPSTAWSIGADEYIVTSTITGDATAGTTAGSSGTGTVSVAGAATASTTVASAASTASAVTGAGTASTLPTSAATGTEYATGAATASTKASSSGSAPSGSFSTVTYYVNTASSGGDGTTNGTSGSTAAFASLAAAEAALRRDLVAQNQVVVIQCSGATADTSTPTWGSGWTTDSTHYIEVRGNNTSGKWDPTKYRLSYTDTQQMLNSGVNHIHFVDVQWTYSRTTGTTGISPIRVNARSATFVDIRFERCVFRCTGVDASVTGNTYCIDVRLDAADQTFILVNCAFFGWKQTTGISGALVVQPAVSTAASTVVYNCSIADSTRGINVGANAAGTVVVKNTISTAATPYNGSFSASSTNNLSSTSTVPGSNGITSATVTFVDDAGGDLHLAASDSSGAKTGGANLTSDATYPVTTDIDGQTRPASGAWSIGADEYGGATTGAGEASTSVATSGTILETRVASVSASTKATTAGTSTVSGTGAATASTKVASDATAVQSNPITSDGEAEVRATVAGTGTSGSTTTVTRYVNTASAGGDGTTNGTSGANAAFASLSAAEVALRRDLVTLDQILVIECSGSIDDTSAVTFGTQWTTDANHYVEIRGNNTTGKWDDSKYTLYRTNGTALTNTGANFVRHKYVQFAFDRTTNTASFGGVRVSARTGVATDIRFESCLVRCLSILSTATFTTYGFDLRLAEAAQKLTLVNCVVIGVQTVAGGGIGTGYIFWGPADNVAYNCLAYDCGRGFAETATADGTVVLKNCMTQVCPAPYTGGIWSASSTNNLSNTSATAGSNGLVSKTVTFVDAPALDFHIAASDTSGAKTGGANLSADARFAFAVDIDGQARPGGATAWSIGPDEFSTVTTITGVGTAAVSTTSSSGTGASATSGAAQATARVASAGVATQITTAAGTAQAKVASAVDATASSAITGAATASTTATTAGTGTTAGTSVVTRYVNTASSGGDGTTNATSGATAAFASLAAAEAALRRDLVSLDQILLIECSGTADDTTAVTWNTGWTTDAGHYIEVRGDNSTGRWDDTKYTLARVDGVASTNTAVNNVRHTNVQFGLTRSASALGFGCVRVSARTGVATDIRFVGCIVRSTDILSTSAASTYGFDIRLAEANQKVTLVNCVVDGIVTTTGGGTGSGYLFWGAADIAVYNCLAYNSGRGFAETSTGVGQALLKNCMAQACATPFNGTFKAGSTNNLSSNASVPGASGLTNKTVAFVNATTGDYHLDLSDTSGAKTGGANLSTDTRFSFAVDYEGQNRPAGSTAWSIGPDEYADGQITGAGTASTKTSSSATTTQTPNTPADGTASAKVATAATATVLGGVGATSSTTASSSGTATVTVPAAGTASTTAAASAVSTSIAGNGAATTTASTSGTGSISVAGAATSSVKVTTFASNVNATFGDGEATALTATAATGAIAGTTTAESTVRGSSSGTATVSDAGASGTVSAKASSAATGAVVLTGAGTAGAKAASSGTISASGTGAGSAQATVRGSTSGVGTITVNATGQASMRVASRAQSTGRRGWIEPDNATPSTIPPRRAISTRRAARN